VVLDGRVVREPGTDRGFVFQNDSLLPWRTVLANAIIGREVAGAIVRRRSAPWNSLNSSDSKASSTIIRASFPAACVSAQSRARARHRSPNLADG